jgi:RNA polymerase sigma-70 factor, ECF subfamily
MLDPQTVAQIIIRERSGLTAYIYTVARNYHLAEDVFQDTFVKANQRSEKYDSKEHLINWFRVAARNRTIDLIRSTEGRYTGLSQQTLEALEEDWSAVVHVQSADAMDALAGCLDGLSEKNSEIIRLRYFENRDCQTISRLMNRKIKAIYQSIFRIQKHLEKCVNERLENRNPV